VIRDTVQLDPYHVIAFGLPTRNPLIAMLNEQLPQPFVPGEDNLRQEVGSVVYRLPQGFSLGLLQALPAPWNPQKSILVVTGTSLEGMQWALNTLTNDLLYYELRGDLAFIRTNYLETFESAKFVRGPLLAAVEAIATAEATPIALEKVEPTPTASPASASVSSAATPQPGQDTAPAAIPPQYLPPDHSPSIIISRLIMGLIGAGVVIVAVGGVASWRKAKIR
ncbi:MAG: hypothetical protein HYR94_22645, partial [Chloroflexi bacterium]|nr:hypothetical protein [Chloroflexota bacterium]